jgi:hypothetical protein
VRFEEMLYMRIFNPRNSARFATDTGLH